MVELFRQAKWNEPLIVEYPDKGLVGLNIQRVEAGIVEKVGGLKMPKGMMRETPINIPNLPEVVVVRHYTRLSQMSYGVDTGPVPLGSCTMKYNPRLAWDIAFDNRIVALHPLQDESTVQGLLQILFELQKWLASITGMDVCSLHPAAGAHGELAGVLTIRRYHELKGNLGLKREIIIPDSAHGTNPASASMAGFATITVPTGEDGNVDFEALKSAVGDATAGLMITNPSTLGLFEERIIEIAELLHNHDALLYYDGANLNGIMGYARPGDMGFDIAHLNIHKTFSSPHGGGGPGAGVVCVRDRIVDERRGVRLSDLIPGFIVVYDRETGLYKLKEPGPYSVGLIKAFFGNVIPLVWAYVYIASLGPQGLRKVAEHAVMATNYFIKLVEGVKGLEIPFGRGRFRKHEVVLSASKLAEDTGVTAMEVAKGLLDAGFYAPTVYFPLIVKEALQVEFTEAESLENIERYAERLREISKIAYENPEVAKSWPSNTSVRLIDYVRGDHPKTVSPTWRVYMRRMRGELS